MRRLSSSRVSRMLLALSVAASTSALPRAAFAVENICFPQLGTVTGQKPTIDGVIGDPNMPDVPRDPGWNGASMVYLNYSDAAGFTKLVALQLGVSGTDVYIGGVVTLPPGQPASNLPDNTLIFGFSPDDTGTSGMKLEIQPLLKADTGDFPPPTRGLTLSGSPSDIAHAYAWTNPTSWTSSGQTSVSTSSWLADPSRFAYARHGNHWSFEMKIPKSATNDISATGGVNFGAAGGTFRFYFDTITSVFASATTPSAYEEYSFPPNLRINDNGSGALSSGLIETMMPPRNTWAIASLPGGSGSCGSGVSLSGNDFRIAHSADGSGANDLAINHPNVDCARLAGDPSYVPPGPANNWFTASPQNSGSAAANVGVRFRVAGFGLPSSEAWKEIPGSPAVVQSIPAGSPRTYQVNWQLSSAQWCNTWAPTLSSMGHQCIEAEMFSNDGTARFLNRSVQNNAWWGTASTFKGKAQVATKGYGPPPAGSAAHKFLLFVEANALSLSDEERLAKLGVRPEPCSAADPERTAAKCCVRQSASQPATMNEVRRRHSATALPDGKVLVAGAIGSHWAGSATAEIYDPATNTWAPAKSLSRARFDHAAVPIGGNGVLLLGGGSISANEAMGASTDYYSIAERAWSPGPSITTGYLDPSAVALGNGLVLLAGGQWNETFLYNLKTNAFEPTGNLKQLHSGGHLVALGDGRALYVGGRFAHEGGIAEVFDPRERRWSSTGNLINPRTGHTATLLKNGSVLITGGYAESDLRSAEIYEPGQNAWRRVRDMNVARSAHAATLLADGRVLVTGGRTNPSQPTQINSAEIYDPATDIWTFAPQLAEARMYHTATLLADGTVLIAGGSGKPTSERYSPAGGPLVCSEGQGTGPAPTAGNGYRTTRNTTWGYRMTGSGLTINGKKYERAEYVGNYSYLVRHFISAKAQGTGTVPLQWSQQLAASSGATSMVKLPYPGSSENKDYVEGAPLVEVYALDVPPNATAEIGTVISAVEGPAPCTQVFGKINCCRCALGTGLGDDDLDGRLSLLVAAALLGLAVHRRRRAN